MIFPYFFEDKSFVVNNPVYAKDKLTLCSAAVMAGFMIIDSAIGEKIPPPATDVEPDNNFGVEYSKKLSPFTGGLYALKTEHKDNNVISIPSFFIFYLS